MVETRGRRRSVSETVSEAIGGIGDRLSRSRSREREGARNARYGSRPVAPQNRAPPVTQSKPFVWPPQKPAPTLNANMFGQARQSVPHNPLPTFNPNPLGLHYNPMPQAHGFGFGANNPLIPHNPPPIFAPNPFGQQYVGPQPGSLFGNVNTQFPAPFQSISDAEMQWNAVVDYVRVKLNISPYYPNGLPPEAWAIARNINAGINNFQSNAIQNGFHLSAKDATVQMLDYLARGGILPTLSL